MFILGFFVGMDLSVELFKYAIIMIILENKMGEKSITKAELVAKIAKELLR